MSKAGSARSTPDDARELEAVAGELYGLQPDAFAAARDERIRTARADGRQPLARELSKLRRPTQSAWLINLLWREQREIMQQFLELGGELSRAQAAASGPELQRLTALRRELEGALIGTARGLAHAIGANVSASTEREAQETLSAALARPEVADQVRSGRLLKPATYAGFGTVMPPAPAAAAPKPSSEDADRGTTHTRSAPTKLEHREARVAQHARERRAAAEREVEEARAALAQAVEALAEAAKAMQAAHQQHVALRQQAEGLEEQLRALQEDLNQVKNDAASAGRLSVAAAHHKEQAEAAHQAALRTLNRAEQVLKDEMG